jgi:glycerophosphoryl diester phosphodiesterase
MAALIIAHRGGAPDLGENSRAAFRAGLDSGADMLEMDVQRSADGHLVVIHDNDVTVSDGTNRPVGSLPLSELRASVSGLLTFDEYLEEFGKFRPTNVDLKLGGYEMEIVRLLRRHRQTEEVLVSSRKAGSLRQVKLLAPETSIGLSRGQLVPWLGREPHSTIAEHMLRPTLPAQLLAHGKLALADSFMLNYRLIQPWLVDFFHKRNYRVFCWTANDAESIRRLDQAGVDGIATDHPHDALRALQDSNDFRP